MSLKLPADIGATLIRQWERTDRRLRLFDENSWPIRIPLAAPTAREITNSITVVRDFLDAWRQYNIGHVCWHKVSYRSLPQPLEVPESVSFDDLPTWIEATQDRTVRKSYHQLRDVLRQTDQCFHNYFVRRKHIVGSMSPTACFNAACVALSLTPGCAQGAPLRAVAVAGMDTKFIERHRMLITELMDIRYDGDVRERGLEAFLGCSANNFQWLLVADLDGSLLPVDQMRVRDTEIATTPLPGTHVLIVENEQCLHQIPALPGTIAILGAGLNLTWMEADWLRQREVAYWGDIDSWGMTMLGMARVYQPGLQPMLMNREVFDRYENSFAVVEPEAAGSTFDVDLTEDEAALLRHLIQLPRGRLEQERVPKHEVEPALKLWISG